MLSTIIQYSFWTKEHTAYSLIQTKKEAYHCKPYEKRWKCVKQTTAAYKDKKTNVVHGPTLKDETFPKSGIHFCMDGNNKCTASAK